MSTKYASEERLEESQIDNQFTEISNVNFINSLFDSLPYIAAVLNEQRQVIFSNKVLLEQLGVNSISDVLGLRTGEMLNCMNSAKEEGGCGTSEDCKYCGAINAIIKSQTQNVKVNSECTIRSNNNGKMFTYEFGLAVNPFDLQNERFYILTLFDISDSKRRLFLEKIFFHDIINKAGSLNGFLQLVKAINDPLKLDEYIEILDDISQQLIKEIFSQQQLMEAENGTLVVNKELIESKSFLQSMIVQISEHKVAKQIKVVLSESAELISFFSDSSLLGRIVLNMLKNAVEASSDGDIVTVNCTKIENKIQIAVNNPVLMSEEVKSRIFNRSFSTKGTGRGLGTYSMKVLAENYLKGKIYFESIEKVGTTFFLELAIDQ
jgi:signal transduction histidine kinase